MNRPVVLVVEDDAPIRRGLVDALTFAGYRVLEAADGDRGLATALGADLDLLLLDILLPGRDGFSVLEEVRRARPRLQVILVTARGMEEDRVRGLQGGADDYVSKPFSARELLARVAAVLRRSAGRPLALKALVRSGRRVDFERREATLPDGSVRLLSDTEARLLAYLAGSPGRAVSREELLRAVWGIDPRGAATRTVDVHVARLREKLACAAAAGEVVVTVRSLGYMVAAGDRE